MIIDYLEVSGFRGFREKVRIDFGKGFTVISGRNGVGKSTIFDAVEFAVTGSIDKYTVEKAAKESFSDYIWWRGDGVPNESYVTVSFLGKNGEPFTITRTRESGANYSSEDIQKALCSEPGPENALQQLAKTSIIRDELISALSLDLSETERFELVRSALGVVEGKELADKAKRVISAVDDTHARNVKAYDDVHEALSQQIARQSEAKAKMQRADDVSSALELIASELTKSMFSDKSNDVQSLLEAGRRFLADGQIVLGDMGEALAIGQEVQAHQQAYNSSESVDARAVANDALNNALSAKSKAESAVEATGLILEREEASNAVASSLAALIEHGQELGLHGGNCPLCSAERTLEEFQVGLSQARERVLSLSSGIQQERQKHTEALAELQRVSALFIAAEQKVAELRKEGQRLRLREQAHVEYYERKNLPLSYINSPEELAEEIGSRRDKLIDHERALFVLEASQSVSQLSSIEESIASLREQQDKFAYAMQKSEAARATSREIERSIRRVNAELIDERLSQISPLLNELYQRLRPHANWKTIEYSIRGDVRKFLSLKVGEGLNPQFMFSSGQRRAAGLAFLLSVYLSRGWVNVRTLFLDDPVQHIDDFRALHLVEVLAALRLDGRQIVCAVEDPALADLLCRRLVSTGSEEGQRIEVAIGTTGLAEVVDARMIPPMPSLVLQKMAGSEAG